MLVGVNEGDDARPADIVTVAPPEAKPRQTPPVVVFRLEQVCMCTCAYSIHYKIRK